jgi:hypothetical protein
MREKTGRFLLVNEVLPRPGDARRIMAVHWFHVPSFIYRQDGYELSFIGCKDKFY